MIDILVFIVNSSVFILLIDKNRVEARKYLIKRNKYIFKLYLDVESSCQIPLLKRFCISASK